MDEAAHPHDLPEPGLLRKPRVRHRSRGADVFLQAGDAARPLGGGASRRADPGALQRRSVHRSGPRSRAAAGGAGRDARHPRHHAAHLPEGARREGRPAPGQALQQDPRAVLLRLRARPADPGVRRGSGAVGRHAGVHDHRAALPAARGAGDPRDAHGADGSRGGAHLDQPALRRDPRHGGRHPEPAEERVQPALAGTPPARIDLQDVRPHRGGRAGDKSGLDVLRVGPLRLQDPSGGQLRRRQLVVRPHVRERLLRMELDPQRDAALGQLRLRAADARRHAREGCGRRASHGRSLAARRQRRVRALHRPRVDRGLPARPHLGVRDACCRRGSRRPDGHQEGRPRRRPRRHRRRLGTGRSDTARSRRASPRS